MKDFWHVYKFGDLPLEAEGKKKLYSIVVAVYGQLWYVVVNVLAFVALGNHLWHGILVLLKALEPRQKRLYSGLKIFSLFLTVLLTAGFIFIPIYVYLNFHA